MFDPELLGDDHRGAGRRQADQVGTAGAATASASASTTASDLDDALQSLQPVQPPDRERRAAIGLVDDRALVDRVQRVVAERGDRDERDAAGEG